MTRTTPVTALWIYLVCLLAAPLAAAGETPLTYDRVHISASASTEVDNDTLVATVTAQRDGTDPAGLADEVNKLIAWAVTEAKQLPQVRVQTLTYNTAPVYRDNVLSEWRVSQSLRLEGQDGVALTGLLGKLQQKLALGSASYVVSPEQRKTAENGLVTEALAAFKSRAELVAQGLGRQDYRLVSMDVATAGQSIRPVPTRAMAKQMRTLPTLEAGSQTVTVTVSGTIELK
jgi:predicted secreted protein